VANKDECKQAHFSLGGGGGKHLHTHTVKVGPVFVEVKGSLPSSACFCSEDDRCRVHEKDLFLHCLRLERQSSCPGVCAV
jgi:hypothetical protein